MFFQRICSSSSTANVSPSSAHIELDNSDDDLEEEMEVDDLVKSDVNTHHPSALIIEDELRSLHKALSLPGSSKANQSSTKKPFLAILPPLRHITTEVPESLPILSYSNSLVSSPSHSPRPAVSTPVPSSSTQLDPSENPALIAAKVFTNVAKNMAGARAKLRELEEGNGKLLTESKKLKSEAAKLKSETSQLKSETTKLKSDMAQLKNEKDKLESEKTKLIKEKVKMEENAVKSSTKKTNEFAKSKDNTDDRKRKRPEPSHYGLVNQWEGDSFAHPQGEEPFVQRKRTRKVERPATLVGRKWGVKEPGPSADF